MEDRIFELKNTINNAIEQKEISQLEISRKADVQQSTLSRFLKNEDIPNISASFFLKLSDFFYNHSPTPTIKRPEAFSPAENIEGEDLISVDVCTFAGAGSEASYQSLEPINTIKILPAYYRPDLKVIQIIGDSMSPTIEDTSYVGVIPCEPSLYEGKIYLVSRPPFGLMVKRVFLSEQEEIILRSDNKEHKDIVVSYEGYEDIVIGRVVWVWQNV